MSRAKIHYRARDMDAEHVLILSLCGMTFGAIEATTRNVGAVTCVLCERKLAEPVAVPVPEDVPFVPRTYAPGEWSKGCRVEMRLPDENKERAQWQTWQAFLDRYYRNRDDGAALKSTSEPSRFEGHAPSQTTPEGDRAQRMAGEYAFAARILDSAYADGFLLSDVPRRYLTRAQCHVLLENRVSGRLVAPTHKKGVAMRVTWDAHELAEAMTSACGFEVSVGDVQRVFVSGGREIEEQLLSRGMVSSRDARLLGAEDMSDPVVKKPWDLEGAKAIADSIQVTERTLHRWAAREEDPFPMRVVLGRLVASVADIEAWLKRQVMNS